MNGADQASSTDARGMHRRQILGRTTAALLAGTAAVLTGGAAAAGPAVAPHGGITVEQAVAVLQAAPSQSRDDKLWRLGAIANGTKAPLRQRALYALADEALRLAALEPPDTGEVEPPHPDAKLLGLAAAFFDEDVVVAAWNAGEVAEDLGEAAHDRWWASIEALTEIPAATTEGLRVKARCALRALEVTEESSGVAEDCARSILAEFASWRAAA